MTKKKTFKFKSKLAIGLVFVLAVIYTFYHISNLLFGQDIKTIASGMSSYSETVSGRGYVFRDEYLLTSENKGVVDYHVENGQSVSANQLIADVYEERANSSRELMKMYDRYISVLEKSDIKGETVDLISLRQEANQTYYSLIEDLNMGDTGELDSQIEQMMVLLNKINVLSDGQDTVLKTLEYCRQERDKMLSGDCESKFSYRSGYFYYYPDGYEDIFSLEMLDKLTNENFYQLESYFLRGNRQVDPSVYGKIAYDSSWRFVISLSSKDAAKIEVDGKYTVIFPDNNNTELIMSLEKKIEAPQKEETICIFYCNRLPNNFKLERVQNAQIAVSTVKGIYVPRTALAKEDGITGVYVLRGSVVYFRRVEIVYNGIDYCLVAQNAKDEGGFYALGINELIITNGKNLFHGRVLE